MIVARSPSANPAVELSVVVPTYRRPDALTLCLRALGAQSRPASEIVVVIRPDDDESRLVVAAEAPSAVIVTIDTPGQVAALNRGCEAARGEILAITDDDAVPRPDWLRAIAARFATDAAIGAVGGRDVVHHGDEVEEGDAAVVGRVLWWGRRVGNHHLQSRLQDVDFLKGANMAFRATARQPFDPRLWGEGAQVCNDLEATWSVRRRGWRVVYDPEIAVDHYPAPRHDGDGRAGRSVRAERDEEHNEVYALLRHAAWWHRPILLAYKVLVGTRKAPGLLLAFGPGSSSTERARVLALSSARISALRSLRQQRHAAVARSGWRAGRKGPGGP